MLFWSIQDNATLNFDNVWWCQCPTVACLFRVGSHGFLSRTLFYITYLIVWCWISTRIVISQGHFHHLSPIRRLRIPKMWYNDIKKGIKEDPGYFAWRTCLFAMHWHHRTAVVRRAAIPIIIHRKLILEIMAVTNLVTCMRNECFKCLLPLNIMGDEGRRGMDASPAVQTFGRMS